MVFDQGVGTVVSGTLITGVVQPNDTLLLGPDSTGKFQPVQIKSMHRKRVNVTQVRVPPGIHKEEMSPVSDANPTRELGSSGY